MKLKVVLGFVLIGALTPKIVASALKENVNKIKTEKKELVNSSSSAPEKTQVQDKKVSGEIKQKDKSQVNKPAEPELHIIDGTVATAYNPEGNVVVLLSDIRPSLDGKQRTLKDVLFEELALRDAKKLHVEVSDEDVDRYLAMLQKQTGYTIRQIEKSFADLGYTIEQGREQLKRTNIIQEVVSYRVRQQSQVLVTEEAVKEFYEKNPIIVEESYKIEQTFFAFNKEKTVEENLQGIEKLIESGDIQYAVSWDEPIEFKVSEFSEDQKFIVDMNIDQVSIFKKNDEGVFLVKLISKTPEHQVALEERRSEIEDILKTKVYEDRMKEYENRLFEAVKIRYHSIQIPDQEPSI